MQTEQSTKNTNKVNKPDTIDTNTNVDAKIVDKVQTADKL